MGRMEFRGAMDDRIQSLLREYKRGLEALYGGRLGGFFLYGSFARGEQEPESDLDLVVVLPSWRSYVAEIERTSALTSDLSLEYGVSIRRVFVSQDDWLRAETPFLAAAREEAIAG